ncbi:MAG: FxsA family protein [Corynebacterium variabile]|nr:FxsA family protein [Corynebacterium variabile]
MLRAFPLIYLIAEVVVFILLGQWIGFGWAFPILIFSPFIGFLLARGAFRRMRARMPSQRSTSKSTDTFTADIAVTVITGILLVTPGILTFVLGLFLLLPPVRSLLASRLGNSLGLRVMSLGERFTVGGASFRRGGTDRTTGEDATSTGGWGDIIDHRSTEFDDDSGDDGRGDDSTGGTPGTDR